MFAFFYPAFALLNWVYLSLENKAENSFFFELKQNTVVYSVISSQTHSKKGIASCFITEWKVMCPNFMCP
jgi:ABC-type Fe3+ transport system permease subunit